MSIKQNLSSLHQICYSESTAESVSRMTSCASILSGAILGFILTITVPAVTMAANECGAEVAGPDTITCAPGVYPTGIAYSNSDGLTLIIDDSTGTVGNPGVQVSSSAVGVGDIAIIGTNIGTTSTTAAVRHALFSNINNTSSTATASVLLSDGAVNTSGFFSLGIYVRNAGLGDALIQIDGGTITTTDDFAYGGLSYIANTNSTATATAALTGGDITTTGGTGVGIFALNWGLGESLAQMDGGTINLSGMGHFGIISTIDNAANTATATALLTGGTITLGNDGLGFGAVNVTHSGLGESLIQMDGGTINTTGPNSLGLISEVQNVENTAVATVILTGGDIMTTGANSHGISVRHQGLGAVNISTVGTGTILTTGAEAHGIAIMHDNALATGTTTITLGGNIIAGGDGINVNSLSTGAVLITGNGNITGGADVGDDGIDVTTQGSVTIDVNGTISGDPGILVSSANGPIIIGGAGDVSGAGGNGIDTTITSAIATDDISIARDGIISGSVNGILATNDGMGNVNITANQAVSGGTAYGINTNTLAGSNTTIIPNSGAAVSSTAGLGIFNNGGDSTTTVNTGASVAGTISLGDGSDNLTFAGGDFSGVTLFDGGDDTDTADGFTDVLTFSGSSAALVGANIVNWENVVIDAGSIMSFSDNLLTAGTLTTNAGGILDASGSALAITGNLRNSGILTMQDGVAGDSVIVSGDYTGGGQLLVDVDTSTDSADTLVLQGANSSGTTSVSVNDIAAAGSATGNDIVVVDDTASGAAIFNLVSPPIVNGAFNYNALNNVGDDWVLQADFTAIASAYEHITAGMFTLNRLPTLQERIDNRNWQQTGASSGDTTNPKADAWLTVVGGKAKQDANNSTTSANYEVDYQQIKLGIDVKSKKTDEGYLMLGVNINSSAADTDVSTTAGNSNIDTDGYGIGLSATWYDNEGLYIDGQVQKNWYELDLAASGVGGGASAVDGDGYTASIEVGQRHSINDENTLFVTPQAQLIYSTIDFDSFVGPNAEQVALVENKSLRVRLGVTLDRNITKKDERSHTYFIANVIHEFNNDRSVNVSGFNLDSNADDWTGEIGVGGSYNWNNDEHSLYGEIKANTSLNKIGDNNGYEGRIGVRINF